MPGVQTCALRSEEHTSELQSHDNLVCRLLLEKKTNICIALSVTPSSLGVAVRTAGVPLGRAAGLHGRRHGERALGHLIRLILFFFFLKERAPPKFPPLPHPALFRF